MNASQLYQSLLPISQYYDKASQLSREEYFQRLAQSNTLYIGNLSIYTTEEQIFELFNRVGGGIRKLIMGRNKTTGAPIGFCFIEYFTHEDAHDAIEYLNLLKLDDRAIRCDWDIGYSEGREFGRGQDGYQVRDAYRKAPDSERYLQKNKKKLLKKIRPMVNKQGYRGKPRGGRRYGDDEGRRFYGNDDDSDHSDSERKKRKFSNKKRYY